MIRGLTTTIVCACLAGAVGVGLFFVKHDVKEQEARLAELNQEIQANQEAIHVLKAEWSYLNDPTRLRNLSEKFLSMKVMGPGQIASLDTLPGGNGPAYAANRGAAQPNVARTQPAPAAAPAPVTTAKAAPATTAKPAPVKLAAGKPAPHPAKPATKVAAAPATRVAAAPLPTPQPAVPAATQHQSAPPAPARSIVIQSPALASTPALPGEVR
ncbi:MAG TPA: energy transducer TonB [Magnetospirillum sp.]|nr:energy transducer TonB [Magnetospirillum sp.]